MTQLIQLDESNVSRRVIYLWSVLSNGTSPAQFETGGQPQVSVAGIAPWNSAGTLLSINTANGEYAVRLGTSDVSVLGPGILRYSSSSALEVSIPFQIVGFNPYGSISTFNASTDSVGLKAQTHSGATVAGLVSDVSIRNGDYSAVTIAGVNRVNSNVTIANADYSAVTVRVNGGVVTSVTNGVSLAAGRYSNVTIGGVERVESHVTIASGSYSSLTIAGVERVNSSVTIANADYSGVTVRTSNVTIASGGIVASSFGAGAIDAVAIATDATEDIADGLLGRNIAGGSSGGRTVSQALYPLRNRVQIDGSIGTVYQVNDSTSAWTFSAFTVSANSGVLNQVDPGT